VHLVALREAITGQAGMGTILTRVLPVWGEDTLLFPTIAGLVHLFRPPKLVKPAPVEPPAQPARPAPPTPTPRRAVANQQTFPSPAVKAVPPQEAPAGRA